MDNWNVFLAVGEIIAFLAVLLPPAVKLARAMTKLEETISATAAQLAEYKTDNTAAHKRIWDKVDEHDEKLTDHDKRITILEHEKGA